MPRICIFPPALNTGGVSSFQAKLTIGLQRRGFQVTASLQDSPDAVLLTSTTRQIPALLALRRRGVPIVQRLDGINWLHRRLPTGLRHFLRAEYGNRSRTQRDYRDAHPEAAALADDGLEEAIQEACRQIYPEFEIICGVADAELKQLRDSGVI